MIFRCFGMILLTAAGWGGGVSLWKRKKARWQQIHTFARLLRYLQNQLEYLALSGDELLVSASAWPEFAALGIQKCRTLQELPVPEGIEQALADEIRTELGRLGLSSRENACRSLCRLERLCAEEAAACKERAGEARSLYPKLGACAGLAAAIIFL